MGNFFFHNYSPSANTHKFTILFYHVYFVSATRLFRRLIFIIQKSCRKNPERLLDSLFKGSAFTLLLVHTIVRSFLGYMNVMGMAFLQGCGGNLDKSAVFLQFINGLGSAVAHAGT